MCKSFSMATTEQLMGSAEACGILGIDRSTLTRWVAKGIITPAQKLPGETGVYLFQPAEVRRVAAEQDGARAS
jgi:predicted site-specific integrase-resolvase